MINELVHFHVYLVSFYINHNFKENDETGYFWCVKLLLQHYVIKSNPFSFSVFISSVSEITLNGNS